LTAEEEKEINALLESVVSQEDTKFVIPDDFKWLKVHFIQKESMVSLQRINKQKQLRIYG
jgi:hypothetical protein